MKDNFDISIGGIQGLTEAINRNPRKTVEAVGNFLVRGIAAYNRRVIRSPWRVGELRGGAPTDTGNLRDTHERRIEKWQAKLMATAPYAGYVHGDGRKSNKRGVQLRPWLDYAFVDAQPEIEELQNTMLTEIVDDLGK